MEPTLHTRLGFSAALIGWCIYRLVRIDDASPHAKRLYLLYVVWALTALGEVWYFAESLLAPAIAGGMVLVVVSLFCEHTAEPGGFAREDGQPPHRALVALHAELIGVPLLHGAVFATFVGWVLSVGFRRGVLRREG